MGFIRFFLLSSAASLPTLAAAQSVDVPQQREANPVGLAEILVTAQKRSENLQNVPIAVSAISQEALASKGIGNVLDLQQAIPNLNISNANGVVNTSIRGVGSNGIAPGFENSVAIYIDGVYVASQVASLLNLTNVSQIAVLKGPQGTLFGRNATGGVLQIVTRQPTEQSVAEGTIGYGNYQTLNGAAYIAGPIAKDLNADIAFYGISMGKGYGNSQVTGHDLYRIKHDITVRSKWVWTPSSLTRITLIGDYSNTSNSINAVIPVPGTVSGYNPAGGPQPDLGYDSLSDTRNFVRGWAAGGTLILDQKIGTLSLTSISAYRESRYRSLFDIDGSNFAAGDSGEYTWPDKQFTQEVQLQSNASGPLKWTVGGYYYLGKAEYDPLIVELDSIGLRLNVVDRLRTESIAGFAQGTYELAQDTNFTLGARYTHETRKVYDGVTDSSFGRVTAPDIKVTFNKLTFRVALDHRFSRDVLAYASFNRGFKSGGFNLSNPGTPAYRPETLDAYEVGLKTDLFDRRVRLNVSGFYNRYSDVQSQILSGGVILIVNAAKATTYGLDADIQAQVSPNFELTGGLGLLSAKYDFYPNAVISTPVGGTPVSFGSAKGNQLPLSSPVTASIGIRYHVPLASGEVSFSPTLSYNSGQYFESDNVIKQGAYALLNAGIQWSSADEHFSLSLYGRNLTDKRVVSWASTTPNGTHVSNYAAPRTYGITAGFKF